MRSHSKARSLPASLLPFVIFISFSNIFVPTGFIPAGQKINKNNNNNNKSGKKSGYGDRFYSTLKRRYLLSDMPKKILRSDSNCRSYRKCYRGTLFWLAVSRAGCAECIYKVVQQHNLGDVANFCSF